MEDKEEITIEYLQSLIESLDTELLDKLSVMICSEINDR